MAKKRQIDLFIKRNYTFNIYREYSESDIRELVSLAEAENKVIWPSAVEYVFRNFNKFSTDFLREVRENCIKELTKEYSKKEATEKTDHIVVSYLSYYLYDLIVNKGTPGVIHFLKETKEGKYNDFINYDAYY